MNTAGPAATAFQSRAHTLTPMTKVLRFTDLIAEGKVSGKRVFIRADLNVPQDDAGKITEDTRIRASVPAIRQALDAGAAVMVTSHLGRPTEGEFKPEDSLAPVAKRLSELLGRRCRCRRTGSTASRSQPGQVVLLENCRVNKGEKKNDDELAQKMAKLCDVYVNDAFGTAHRAEATTHGIAKYAPVACAGPLLAAELDALGKALRAAGASAGGDRRRLEGVDQTDHPEIAGRQGRQPDRRRRHRQYLHAGGRPEDRQVAGRADLVDEAKAIIDMMRSARRLGADSGRRGARQGILADRRRPKSRPSADVADDDMILDIGPKTAKALAAQIAKAGTDRLERPGRRVRVRPVRQRHQDAGAGHRQLEGVLDRRRRRHAGGDREVRHRRQDRLHLDRRRRLPRVPGRQDPAGGEV